MFAERGFQVDLLINLECAPGLSASYPSNSFLVNMYSPCCCKSKSERCRDIQPIPALESDLRRSDTRVADHLREDEEPVGNDKNVRRRNVLDRTHREVVKNYGLRAIRTRNVVPVQNEISRPQCKERRVACAPAWVRYTRPIPCQNH